MTSSDLPNANASNSEAAKSSPDSAVPGNGKNNTRNGNNNARNAVLLVIVVGAVIWGLVHWVRSWKYESTDNAFIEGHVIEMSPRVPGIVARVLVHDNQEVKPGDLLVELDPRDYESRLAQAEAALEIAEAKVREAATNVELTSVTINAGVRQASSGVDSAHSGAEAARNRLTQARAMVAEEEANRRQAQAEADAAEAEAKRAQLDWERSRDAFAGNAISRQQLDLAEATARSSQANFEAKKKKTASVQAAVDQARASEKAVQDALEQAKAMTSGAVGKLAEVNVEPQRLRVSQSQLEMARAEVKRLKALAEQAGLDLSYTRICAPEGGRVTRKSVEAGAFVQVGWPLMAIVPKEVWVVANFKETQLTRMRPGQPVEIRVDAYGEMRLKGHVDSIQSGAGARFSLFPPENATGNFVKLVQRVPVKIVFDTAPGPEHLLGPGMSVVPKVKVK